MSKRKHSWRQPSAMLAAVLFVVVALVMFRGGDAPSDSTTLSQTEDTAASDPADCVADMMAAEKAGDVASWLECFTGSLRATLSAKMKVGSDDASRRLKRGSADLKGHAISDLEFPNPGTATLLLERVYAERNERHRVELTRISNRWKITAITPLERFAPEIPYGTPVFQPPADAESADPPTAERSPPQR